MTLPEKALDDLAAFKTKLPTVVKKKRVRKLGGQNPDDHHEGPANQPEPKPRADINPNVRRNGPKSWLVMLPTAAVMRGVKSREDPVVKDSPITQAPSGVSHMTGVTARICNDTALFKRQK